MELLLTMQSYSFVRLKKCDRNWIRQNWFFILLPERFTLTELQQVYEVILGRLLLKAAFRRKMAPYVQETDQFADKAGHRPSRLYQRNRKDWYDVL